MLLFEHFLEYTKIFYISFFNLTVSCKFEKLFQPINARIDNITLTSILNTISLTVSDDVQHKSVKNHLWQDNFFIYEKGGTCGQHYFSDNKLVRLIVIYVGN